MAPWFALLLSLQGDGAVISKHGGFDSEAACKIAVATLKLRPRQSISCVQADQIDLLTRAVWGRRASEIWK